MKKSMSGFTLIELLVVILVIAILAAIAVVAYNGIQSRAKISVLKVDLGNADRKIQVYFTENSKLPGLVSDLKTNSFGGVADKGVLYDPTGSVHMDRDHYWLWFSENSTYSFTSVSYWDYGSSSWKQRVYERNNESTGVNMRTFDVLDSVGNGSPDVPCTKQYLGDCLPTPA